MHWFFGTKTIKGKNSTPPPPKKKEPACTSCLARQSCTKNATDQLYCQRKVHGGQSSFFVDLQVFIFFLGGGDPSPNPILEKTSAENERVGHA